MQSVAILIVEERTALQKHRAFVLQSAGYDVETASTAVEAVAATRKNPPALAILGHVAPEGDVLALATALRVNCPDLAIIVIVPDEADIGLTAALRAAALEILAGPTDDAAFLAAVKLGLSPARPIAGRAAAPLAAFGAFTGHSPAMAAVYARIRAIARSGATVFITGESGTGKGLCAQAIHRQSGRATGPFIALDCATLTSNPPEGEAFAQPKSSPAEAQSSLANAMAMAEGGSLFLDNICDLDAGLQPILLRFLQARAPASDDPDKSHRDHVRIICATSSDPAEAIRQGHLRADLYYRLHVLSIRMPALRTRGQDVNDIAKQELHRFSQQENRRFNRLSDGVRRLFSNLPWPGNVRQLLNVLHEIVVLHEGEEVTIDMIPPDMMPNPAGKAAHPFPAGVAPFLGKTLAQIERLVIEATIAQHGGSVSRAARVLDVAPSTLYRKIEVWSASDGAEGEA